jgi:hypothetical protein
VRNTAIFLTLSCLLSALTLWPRRPARAQAVPRPAVDLPGVPRATVWNPDLAVRAAAQFVRTAGRHNLVAAKDLPYVRFVSLYNSTAPLLRDFQLLNNWWVNQVSFNPNSEPLKVVPGTGGRLLWLDFRQYNWNCAAVRAVFERELYIAEPWVNHADAEYLRKALHAPLSKEALKGRQIQGPGAVPYHADIYPSGTVVSLQFLRDLFETDRAANYYDLLFASYRFVPRHKVRRVKRYRYIDHPGGLYTSASGRKYRRKKGRYRRRYYEEVPCDDDFKFVDFPRNEGDLERALGVDKVRRLMREKKIDLDWGAVVSGGKDNPRRGSIVALQNRLLVYLFGPVGAYLETYDVDKTVGPKDFRESLIFSGKPFRPGEGARGVRDAGEILFYLPNGGQAGILINGRGDRIEEAANKFARHSVDIEPDARVLTYGRCVECHAPGGGYVAPEDDFNRGILKGVDALFKEQGQRDRVKQFFRTYRKKLDGATGTYLEQLQELTKDPTDDRDKGWDGAYLVRVQQRFRKWYDNSVGIEDAARDVGVPVRELKRVLAKVKLGRAGDLLKGIRCPRVTWERDLLPNVQLLRERLVREREGR